MSVSIQIPAKSASILDLIHVSYRKKEGNEIWNDSKKIFLQETAVNACTHCVPIILLVSIGISRSISNPFQVAAISNISYISFFLDFPFWNSTPV